MSEATSLIKTFPNALLIISFVSGLLFTYFTPLALFITGVLNPFSQSSAPDAISSVIVFILVAFVIGFPAYLLRDLIVSDSGINQKLTRSLKKKAQTKAVDPIAEKMSRVTKEDAGLFAKWLYKKSNRGYRKYIESLFAEAALIDGLIIGSQLSLLLCVVLIPSALVLRFLHFNPLPVTIISDHWLTLVPQIVLNILFFIFLLFYNKRCWRPVLTYGRNPILYEFVLFKEKTRASRELLAREVERQTAPGCS